MNGFCHAYGLYVQYESVFYLADYQHRNILITEAPDWPKQARV